MTTAALTTSTTKPATTMPAPGNVENLTVLEVTTTSVKMSWNNTGDSRYRVNWGDKGNTNTDIVMGNIKTITNLTPGFLYTINVTAVASDNLTEGRPATKTVHTKPEAVNSLQVTGPVKPVNVRVASRSTDNLNINWTLPEGRVDYYSVNISNQNVSYYNTSKTNDTMVIFSGLHPGRLFLITVTAVAGNLTNTSDQFSFATYPKPPQSLIIIYKTISSLQLQWSTFPIMNGAPGISYFITYQPSLNNISSINESIVLDGLQSGTLYNIRVKTVGPDQLESTAVSNSTYTLPDMVSKILAIGTTTNMSVSWTKAGGQVSSYFVQLWENTAPGSNQTTLSNETTQVEFVGLTPGVLYFVEVVTISGPEKSNKSSVSNATFPTPPASITVNSQTVSSINFTWTSPADMPNHLYNYSVHTANGSYSTQNNWFLLENLLSGSSYNVSVVTVGVLGYRSAAISTTNYTKPQAVMDLMATEVTTSSVTLKWNQSDSKSHYSYEVRVESVSMSELVRTTNSTTITVNGLESGRNYTFTVTTFIASYSKADPVKVFYFTRPYNITDLKVLTLNTTAIYLNWTKPYEYKANFKYLVETTGCGNKTNNSTVDNITFSELIPGTNCNFCVSVMAANGIKGKETCITQYTKPEVVKLSISNNGFNNSVLVSWTKPAGNVEMYRLQLNSSSTNFSRVEQLNFTSTSFLFTNLSAAVLYSAVMIANSGPFYEPSEMVTNATYPNPPGPIEILSKTTDSIDLLWGAAPLMSTASGYFYKLTYNPLQQVVNVSSAITHLTLSSLLSGTSYNISVRTVGPMDFESESVYKYMVTTRPYNVTSLSTMPTERNINVTWSPPIDYKNNYHYSLTWQSSDDQVFRNISYTESKYITNLMSGTEYNINVTTKTSDGTQSATVPVSTCTDASPVKDLTCKGPNSGEAKVNLHWSKPDGKSSGFQFTVLNGSQNNTSEGNCCTHTISNLAYHSEYNITVKTQSCGKPSTPEMIKCLTGVAKPPVPLNFMKELDLTKDHQTFTVKIKTDLIDNSKGPVTHVGILVASDDNAQSSNLEKFLVKTYDDWKKKSAQVYLATVVSYITTSRSSTNSLEISVGTKSTWEVYRNDVLDPSGTYKYSIVMFTYLAMDSNRYINISSSVFSITVFSGVTLDKDPVITWIAVGVTVGIFGLLFFILIGFVIYWRRLIRKESPDIQIQSLGSMAVRVEDFEAYYRKQKADSNCGFAEEFEDIKPVGTAQAKMHALAMENKPKNRYNNVLPYDSSRVKLSVVRGSPNEDYINANYMPGYLSRKEFIAAQGPLPATVNEFWRMIWEKNVHTLVMLTRCNEQGRVKCEQYWGPSTKYYEDIIVTTTSEILLEDWTIRDFDIKNVKTTEVRSVRHFHFTAWPDHGVPETTELLISFRHLVREHMNQYSRNSPTVVHCSAGVGRTGTFIAIDRLIFQIERENIVDVYGIVHDLRMHRPLMVQTEDQYVFLNQCALDIIRARTGNNVDLIYQNTAAISIYENVEPKMKYLKTGS
ncbi:hypothetical protein ATANTOWER_009842 [Ataeniobius toweri]|uniref:protein-tyrosine-phosphatase n=1 Tax=Ataeniobius toweri TaxID=208326 RepID=A0ABU7C2K6_9TELE|nr:hypothetical protein [Ataeniobius toweri]